LKRVIGGLAVLALLLAACSSDEETPAPDSGGEPKPVAKSPPAVSLDFATCEGFLDDPASDLVSRTQELTEPASNDNRAVQTMCSVSHQTPDATKAMTLTVTFFDSNGGADSQYNLVRAGLAADDAVQLTEGVDGPRSLQAVVDNVGVGSFVVVQKGLVVISLHTAMPTGEAPIRDPEELLEIAKGVTAKLP